MDKTLVLNRNGKEFHFTFNPQTDWPEEGATLTAVIKNGRRISPSSIEQEMLEGTAINLLDHAHAVARARLI